MIALPEGLSLPTLDRLKAIVPDELDSLKVARDWFSGFATHVVEADVKGVVELLVEDAFWRDMLSMTWEFRTFHGAKKIQTFLGDRLGALKFSNLVLDNRWVELQRPYPDIAWIQGLFKFDTSVGTCSGVFRLVPTSSGDWKAHTIFTNLEGLRNFPEKSGHLRNPLPNHGLWPEQRRREIECEDEDPKVIVIGAGQSGLEVGARLKYLGVKSLLIERQKRVGDQWRLRYEALCLHDPVWYDHMPYIPFPSTWPTFTPAPKLADWLENYAHAMELNVWTSSTVTRIEQDPQTHIWTVDIRRETGTIRTFRVKHVIFAVGWSGGAPHMPIYPGMDEFKGQILHSSQHKSARDHIGKKVVVVGACTSGHDLSGDYYNHGVDVTLYQRGETYIMSTKNGLPRLLGDHYSESAPPTDIADLFNASYPNHLTYLIHQRRTKEIAEADKEILDGLKKRGFRLGWGHGGSGFLTLALTRSGGYYLDVGTSKLIADGKIKLKNDSPIEGFSESGLKFKDGSTLPADVVVFATGFSNVREPIHNLCGEDVVSRLRQVWGLNEEGEINSAWRDTGIPGLYVMMGNLAMCRFHSKHLALQIKAMEEGIFGERYVSRDTT